MRKLVIAIAAFGILIVMAGVRATELRANYGAVFDDAEARTANLSLILSEYLAEAFASSDAALRQLAVHGRRIGGPTAPAAEWGPTLASAQSGLTGVGAITVIDGGGIIRHSTRPEIVGQSRATDPAFRDAMRAKSDDPIVGTPFATLASDPARRVIIPIGRPLHDAAGEVQGVVIASFVPGDLRQFFNSIDVGERGIVWVFHPDGVVLFREPSIADPIGESSRGNPLFAAATQQSEGTLRGPLQADGPVMVSAFHTLDAPRLVVGVSLDRDELLARWRRDAIGSAALFAVLALTLAGALFVLNRQMDAKEAAEGELARSRQLEAQWLRQANEQLTSALQREQSARREAEQASELKDQFLMTVSHELRTPLTAIYGWARMLNQGSISERHQRTALRTIERNAHAQTRLIDDLLDVSRVMGGKLRLDIRPVNVAEVVSNAVETVRPAAAAKGIELRVVLDLAAGSVNGDSERLQQIVWNLLSNAVKFTPTGGRVIVSVARVEREIEIAVSDSGVGISPPFLPHVFERFRQEDAGSKRRWGGLGLGLAIVRNLVELHGGSITAHSEGTGHGATFTVRLPAMTGPALSAQELPVAAAPPPIAPDARLEGLRVLVVDDDVETRELFAAILESAGAVVTGAASASDALDVLRRVPQQVLISDIEMPEIDGYGLVREAMALAGEHASRLVAIAVTAYSRPGEEARALAAGFQRLLQKPLEPLALIGAVLAATDVA